MFKTTVLSWNCSVLQWYDMKRCLVNENQLKHMNLTKDLAHDITAKLVAEKSRIQF